MEMDRQHPVDELGQQESAIRQPTTDKGLAGIRLRARGTHPPIEPLRAIAQRVDIALPPRFGDMPCHGRFSFLMVLIIFLPRKCMRQNGVVNINGCHVIWSRKWFSLHQLIVAIVLRRRPMRFRAGYPVSRFGKARDGAPISHC